MKTIGLVGGTTWVSTIDYYRAINQMVNERLGGNHFARCVIHSFNFHDIVELTNRQDWDALGALLLAAAKNLESSGAECMMLCANTMHIAAETVRKGISVPLIHIGEATYEAVRHRGISKKIALLGTKFTMEKDFIKNIFTAKGIDVIIPDDKERDYIHRSIYDELAKNIVLDSTKMKYREIINGLVGRGAEGVILGCTEIPLLVKPHDVSVPIFDTTLIHAQAAVDFALSS